MKLPEMVGQTYGSDAQVRLDGLAYRNCSFKAGCRVIYCGGPARIKSCVVEAGCVWDFRVNAAYVLTVLDDLGFELLPPSVASGTPWRLRR